MERVGLASNGFDKPTFGTNPANILEVHFLVSLKDGRMISVRPKSGILHARCRSLKGDAERRIRLFSFKFRNIARISAPRERRHSWIELQRP
jgi:hypothetical protein